MANPIKDNKEIGVSGTLQYQGIIRGVDYNQSLTGHQGILRYEIVRSSDATARAALQVCKLPLLSANWHVEPPKNKDDEVDEQDQFRADFLNQQLFDSDFSFKLFLKELLTCLEFGFSVFEKVYQPVNYDGQSLVGIQKIASRKQATIRKWEMEDGQPGIQQQVDMNTYNIPLEKLIIMSYDKEGENYEGKSILRAIYKAWDIKDKLELIMAMADERHAMGIIIGRQKDGQTATPADQAAAQDVLSNIRANESLHMILPNTFEVEMLNMQGTSLTDILPHIVYLDGRIMAGVLARFMEIGGSSGSGSQSLSEDLSSFFMKSEEALAYEIAEYLNKQLIKQLCDLNFSDFPNGYPKLVVTDIADDDMTARITNIKAMLDAGALTKDVDIEKTVREMLDLPAMSEKTIEAYDHQDEVVDQATVDKTVDVAKKTLQETKDVQASLKAAREYRDHLSLISELVK